MNWTIRCKSWYNRTMETTTNSLIDADILTTVIAPERHDLEPAAARSFLKLRFTEKQKNRMHELAEKNNQEVLGEKEQAELESYLRVGSFLNLMKAKARNSLKEGSH